MSGKRPPVPEPERHKYCFICESLKPLDEFYRRKKGRYGRDSSCKPCHRKGPERADQRMRDFEAALAEAKASVAAANIKPYEWPIAPMSVPGS